jgi:hypothetical protein
MPARSATRATGEQGGWTSRTSAPDRLRRSRLLPIGFARWVRGRPIDEGIIVRTLEPGPHRFTAERPPRCEAHQRFGVGCASRSAAVLRDRSSMTGVETELAACERFSLERGRGRSRPVRRARRGFVSPSGRTLKGNEAQEGEGVSRLATIGRTLRTRWRSKASKPTFRTCGALKADSGNGGGRRCRTGSEGTARGQRPRRRGAAAVGGNPSRGVKFVAGRASALLTAPGFVQGSARNP